MLSVSEGTEHIGALLNRLRELFDFKWINVQGTTDGSH
jgi:hypothetical protein